MGRKEEAEESVLELALERRSRLGGRVCLWNA
jgi:hypothetical protein